MPGIEHFSTVNTPLDQYRESIELELVKRVEVPFTKGEIIYAQTESGVSVVVKKPLRKEQAEHEWVGLNKAHSTGILVPLPIALINYSQEQLAIVSALVDGNNLYYFPNPKIKSEIGRQVRIMHDLAEVDGRTWESSGRKTFEYYDKYKFNWSRGKIEELSIDSETSLLLTSLAINMEVFCRESQPTFNHNDLHDGQIIVDKNNTPVIIDFGNWNEETWLNDLGYYLFHLIRTDRNNDDFGNFLDGYTGGKKFSDVEKSNLAFYLLFISSRALAYFYRNNSPYLAIAKDTHTKVLAYLADEVLWKSY
ncbi:MAG TPA: phosphotransferase [Patescibacteria group bacterium]